jgi:hypothetical protein
MKFLQGKTPLFWWRLFLAFAAAAFSLLLILQPAPWRVLADAGGMDKMNIARLIMFWSWWGGLGGIAMMAALFWLAPWWTGAPAPDAGPGVHRAPTPRWFWPLVLAAVAASGLIAAPTMTHSLWDDEIQSLMWYSLGRYERGGEQGKLRFKTWPWRRTFFGYTTPNNHVFYNILSRVFNGTWRAVKRPQGWQFSHLAVRLPAFLAALGSVVLVGLLLKEFGFPAAGAAAAWFLAIHPWFTEHAALARGYTLVMLLFLVAVLAWRRALLTGAWAWWACLAVVSFLLMWTYLAAFFLLVALNLTAVVLILRNAVPVAGPVRTQLSRWFCTNALVAAGALPLFLPLYPQMKKYIATLKSEPICMGAAWLHDVFWSFIGGATWVRGASSAEWHYHDMQLVVGAWGPAGPWILATAVLGPVLAGLWTMARQGRIGCAIVLCTVTSPVLHFLYARLQRIFLYDWYVIYVLPFVALFWGLGALAIARWCGNFVPRWPMVVPATAAALLLVCAAATQPVRAWQTAHPRTPHLESALVARQYPGDHLSDDNRRLLTFAFIHAPLLYDPNIITVNNRAELVLLCRQADREGRALVGSFPYIHLMEEKFPGELEVLRDRRLFGRYERLGSAEPGFDRHVFFYTPGSASAFDFHGLLTPEEIAFVEKNVTTRPEIFFAGKGPQ